jgi:hypothetical protein
MSLRLGRVSNELAGDDVDRWIMDIFYLISENEGIIQSLP